MVTSQNGSSANAQLSTIEEATEESSIQNQHPIAGLVTPTPIGVPGSNVVTHGPAVIKNVHILSVTHPFDLPPIKDDPRLHALYLLIGLICPKAPRHHDHHHHHPIFVMRRQSAPDNYSAKMWCTGDSTFWRIGMAKDGIKGMVWFFSALEGRHAGIIRQWTAQQCYALLDARERGVLPADWRFREYSAEELDAMGGSCVKEIIARIKWLNECGVEKERRAAKKEKKGEKTVFAAVAATTLAGNVGNAGGGEKPASPPKAEKRPRAGSF